MQTKSSQGKNGGGSVPTDLYSHNKTVDEVYHKLTTKNSTMDKENDVNKIKTSPLHSSHSISHIHSSLPSKKSLQFDIITHEPSISSTSSDFIVHPGPSHASTLRTDEDNSESMYETEYQHSFHVRKQALESIYNPAHTNLKEHYHRIGHTSHFTVLDDVTDQKILTPSIADKTIQESSPKQPLTIPFKRSSDSNDCWILLEHALTSLLTILPADEISWLPYAISRVKSRKLDVALERAYTRLQHHEKECIDKLEKMPMKMFSQEKRNVEDKLTLCLEYTHAYEDLMAIEKKM